MAGDMVVGDAVAILTKLQDQGVVLTTRSLQIMNIGKERCRGYLRSVQPEGRQGYAWAWLLCAASKHTVSSCHQQCGIFWCRSFVRAMPQQHSTTAVPHAHCAGDPDKKVSFVEQWQGQPLIATTVITCMDTIKVAIDEVRYCIHDTLRGGMRWMRARHGQHHGC